ncbi:hypothetical protein ACWC6I_34555 [Streptomyces sp. NPDC001414]
MSIASARIVATVWPRVRRRTPPRGRDGARSLIGSSRLARSTAQECSGQDDALAGSPGRDTVHRILTDREGPGQQDDVSIVAPEPSRRAAWDAPDLARGVRELWAPARMAQGAGRPIGELRDGLRLVLDAGLGVHAALDVGDARDRYGVLPTYIPRAHDGRLKTVIDEAKAGRSGAAVLVGGRIRWGMSRSLAALGVEWV